MPRNMGLAKKNRVQTYVKIEPELLKSIEDHKLDLNSTLNVALEKGLQDSFPSDLKASLTVHRFDSGTCQGVPVRPYIERELMFEVKAKGLLLKTIMNNSLKLYLRQKYSENILT